ncbi:hypothetical protein PLESTB_000750800 [Pleodorina starrii]|uniref:Uncharacterized protein n=1 Tax=Pleodorina starrii TaxID=330485 RepID=A0A9W6F2P9_9CHLO|nr:hypothetical protein PLESTB_000750800 [Pleodorina starrii]
MPRPAPQADCAAAAPQPQGKAHQLRRLVGPGARVPRFLLAGTSTYTLVTSPPPPPPPISSPAPSPPLSVSTGTSAAARSTTSAPIRRAGGDGGGRGRDDRRGADTGRDAERGGERSRRSTHDGRATPVSSPLHSPQSSGRSPQQLPLPSKPKTRAAGAAAVLMDLPSRVLAAIERSPQPRPTNTQRERQRRR